MEKVLLIGLITIPLVMFLAFFGANILGNTDTNATAAKSKTDSLAVAAKKQWSF